MSQSTPEPMSELKTIPIAYLVQHVGRTVQILGHVLKLRTGKAFSFIECGYGPTQVQVVIRSEHVTGLTVSSYIRVTGKVKPIPEGKYSQLPVEIEGHKIDILSLSPDDYPSICPPGSGPETRLDRRHFYLRDPEFAIITLIRSQLIQAIRAHFEQTSCTEIQPPMFTGVECEGGATLFGLQHPGKSVSKPMTAYLTQSSQFALEMAVPGIGDCYCVAPSFRAEHSHTRRHLTEFLHAESEWGGILKFEDHLDKLRQLLRGTLSHFLRIAKESLTKLGCFDRVSALHAMTDDIMVLEHKQAIVECTKRGIFKDEETKTPFDERDDIPEAQERALIDSIGKIVFLVKFPKEFKSFYMGLDPEDQTRVLGCDVEVPGVGEIIGSGVREYDFERLHQRLLEAGLKPEDYSEYLDLRKYGFSMTSGMGLGVDRMLTWLLKKDSIRDVVTFPRFPGYLRP